MKKHEKACSLSRGGLHGEEGESKGEGEEEGGVRSHEVEVG